MAFAPMYMEDVETTLQRVRTPDPFDGPPAPEQVAAAALTLQLELERTQRELAWLRAASARAGHAADVPGGVLTTRQDGGGLRHFLDGQPVHAGAGVYLLTDAGWLAGRYENHREDGGLVGVFHFTLPGASPWHSAAIRIPEGARLAWPAAITGQTGAGGR